MNDAQPRGVVALLTAQALTFGVSLALLVVPANSLFLTTYGAQWLPVTYIAIAVVGTGLSAVVARAARRTRLVRVATVTLGALAALYGASWAVLLAGGLWVSAVLLVLFPIALQAGFVFIGGQAGRLLDVRQMKALFPRIVSGFSVGFLFGGLLGIPLLDLLGSTENLLLATTAAQLAFLGLLVLTERRFPEMRTAPTGEEVAAAPRLPLRLLFASGLTLLLLEYQVLSAMGSQVLDFLLFDRASAQYSGAELTRFLSAYTAVLNLVNIVFLALVAGPLLRRFGLRLGLVLNPAVVTAVLVLMTAVAAGPGAAAYALFVLAAVVRAADLAATDGTTRTSINAAYQVVPATERLAVQAVVEGGGVPLAIGVTGALILVIHALGLGTGAVIVFALVLGVAWTLVAVDVYRSYATQLAVEMRRPPLVAGELDLSAVGDAAAVRALLGSDDARDVRLGLDLLAGVASPAAETELRQLAEHADAHVRLRALGQLGADGDAGAAADAAALAQELARSQDPSDRRAAAAALAWRGTAAADPQALLTLLADPDWSVRAAALDAVATADSAEPTIIGRVVEAAGDPRLVGRAAAALRRLGPAAAPALANALADEDRRQPSLVRAAAATAAENGFEVVAPAFADPDRTVVLGALEALAAADGGDVVPREALDDVLRDARMLAECTLAALRALGDGAGPLARALEDEMDLARRLVLAALTLRHGDRVREAARVVEHAEGSRRALGVEALDVLLSREEAALALPLVRRDRALEGDATSDAAVPREPAAWIVELATDPREICRSPWVAACARYEARTRGLEPA